MIQCSKREIIDLLLTRGEVAAWLGFPVVVLGRRVRIPRKRFLEFFREERTE